MGRVESYDEDQGRLARKISENPFFPIGIVGCIAACGVGAYKYRSKGKMSTSVFLMQLRVAAQGTVVASLVIGLGIMMTKKYILDEKTS